MVIDNKVTCTKKHSISNDFLADKNKKRKIYANSFQGDTGSLSKEYKERGLGKRCGSEENRGQIMKLIKVIHAKPWSLTGGQHGVPMDDFKQGMT